MSQFKANIRSRMEELGLTPTAIHAELNARGYPVAYSTVAGWFAARASTPCGVIQIGSFSA